MKCPLVSILVRSTGRDLLKQALDSVTTQTYSNIEVVVVSASVNHQPPPITCGPHPVRFIQTLVPLARSQAANVALNEARGVYALFLDDDDWLMPSHIKRLVDVLEFESKAVAVYSGVSTVDAHGVHTAQVFDVPFDFKRLRLENFIPIHAVLFKTLEVRVCCRFDESLDLYEDWDFWIQVAKLAPIIHLPGVSAVYRVHHSSGAHDASARISLAAGKLYRKWFDEIACEEFIDLVWDVKELNSLKTKVQAQNVQLFELRNKLDATQNNLEIMVRSLSWRLTAPLRTLSKISGLGSMRIRGARLIMRLRAIRDIEGWTGVLFRIIHRLRLFLGRDSRNYAGWLKRYSSLSPSNVEFLQAEIRGFSNAPLVSVVMPVYNPPVSLLKAAVESVRRQIYKNWELCIADDASTDLEVLAYLQALANEDRRIKVHFRHANGHISASSNDALSIATGEWVALLDQDDLLSEDALYWVVKALQTNVDAGIIYSDEDKIGLDGSRCDPYFKPDWSPELLLSQNFISHLGVYRRSLLETVGGFRIGFEGAQDYDLVLRCSLHLKSHQVVHIPRVLYHWRVIPGSTALANSEKGYAVNAGVRAIEDYLIASGLGGMVEPLPNGYYRVIPSLPLELPWVSLIVPTRNAHELVRMCLQSVLEKTTYQNYEVLLVDNGSDEPASLEYFHELSKHPRVQVIRDDQDFNFSALNNSAVKLARGQFVCLLNNDIEILTPNWLEEMVGLALRPGVGAVGARLWYPNNSLQHAGVIIGAGGVAAHAHLGRPRGDGGYFGRAEITQNYQAVTAACLLVRKSTYMEVGGLDEENLKVAFNDVDFCLKLVEAGWRNVWTPFAEMYHHESATRGCDDTPAKKARFDSEVRHMIKRWGGVLQRDATYSPNLSLSDGQFSLAFPPRVDPVGG